MAKSNKFDAIMRKGMLQQKKETIEMLEVQIENLSKDIGFAAYMDDGVTSIDIKSIKVLAKDLEVKINSWQKLKEEIEGLQ